MPGSHHLLSSLVLPEISRCLWCARSALERMDFDLSSLISSSLNSSYQYFSMQKFFETLQWKMQRTFLLLSTQEQWKQVPIKLCKPWAVAGAAAGRHLAGAAIWKQRSSPGTGLWWGGHARQPLPTSTVPPACSQQWICSPGLQASGPHSKLVEMDTTAGSRHIIQCPHFPKYSNCFRSLCLFQPWKLPMLILCSKKH